MAFVAARTSPRVPGTVTGFPASLEAVQNRSGTLAVKATRSAGRLPRISGARSLSSCPPLFSAPDGPAASSFRDTSLIPPQSPAQRRKGTSRPYSTRQPHSYSPAGAALAVPLSQEVPLSPDHMASLPAHVAQAVDEIKMAFDDSATWTRANSSTSTAPTPLLNLPHLSSPTSFRHLSRRALHRAQLFVDRVVSTSSDPAQLSRIVRRLDKLSDEVCAVVDAAEVVRNIHPAQEWREEADRAHEEVSSFLNALNTHRGLYEALDRAYSDPACSRNWSSPERRVAYLLLSDFRRSGIHIRDPRVLKEFVKLNDEVLRLGHQITKGASTPDTEWVKVEDPWRDLAGVGSPAIREIIAISRRNHNAGASTVLSTSSSPASSSTPTYIPTAGPLAAHVIRTCRDSAVRRYLYTAMHSAPARQVSAMDSMLRARARLASLMCSPSYADVFLSDKMAGGRETVERFLGALNEANLPRAREQVDKMREAKRRVDPAALGGQDGTVYLWDRMYLQSLLPPTSSTPFGGAGSHGVPLVSETPAPTTPRRVGSTAGITLGTAMASVSSLLHHLYGIHLSPSPIAPGETWHPTVVRLDAVHEREGIVGRVYVDAAEREGKYSGAAHFTAQCSRRVDWDAEDADWMPEDVVDKEVYGQARWAEGGAAGDRGLFKVPVVVVAVGVGSRLGQQDVETVFHEMGHAVHSMLARTPFQHVSGTRCPLDLVELPSILMELLAPHVLPIHTAPVSPLDLQHQIRLAALDQALHGAAEEVLSLGWSSVDVAARLYGSHDVFPSAGGEQWHARFSHLYAYGCGYYAYLWSRRWAGRVHGSMFAGQTAGTEGFREAGEKVRRELLEWGGGRDGWECVGALGVVEGGEREGAVDVEEVGG